VQADFDGEDAFAQLVSLAVEKDPSLAPLASKHLGEPGKASARLLGRLPTRPSSVVLICT
jgi:hypothetical protein